MKTLATDINVINIQHLPPVAPALVPAINIPHNIAQIIVRPIPLTGRLYYWSRLCSTDRTKENLRYDLQ